MLSRNEFNLLLAIMKNDEKTQRSFAVKMNCSAAKVNKVIKKLIQRELINEEYVILEKGKELLNNYEIDNAIILAAGITQSFAPLSYENPTGLLNVKEEILIERQIKQLKEAGINDISVVIGYKKEKFFYLEEKFDVQLVINEDYYKYGSASSLMRVINKLKNTYICISDTYFTENIFSKYNYEPFIATHIALNKLDKYCCKVDHHQNIIQINPYGDKHDFIMQAHSYFNREFSNKFKEIFIRDYNAKKSVREGFWEDFYKEYLKELPMKAIVFSSSIIHELGSLDELRTFDPYYIKNSDSEILHNICKILKVQQSDIKDIEPIKTGLTNTSFIFKVNNKKYVYRHPGDISHEFVNRESEYFSMNLAKELNIDDSYIYMDTKTGFKISYFIENARVLDYHNEDDIKKAMKLIKELHNKKIKSPYDFKIFKNTKKLIKLIEKQNQDDFEDFDLLKKQMSELFNKSEEDNFEKILCHNDYNFANILFCNDKIINIIDWEYSGNNDPATDIGSFTCCADYTYEEVLKILEIYFERKLTDLELAHYLAYIALVSYYWFVWAILQESADCYLGEFLYVMYKDSKFYMKKANEYYKKLGR